MAGHHQSQAAQTSSATPTRYYRDSSIEDLSNFKIPFFKDEVNNLQFFKAEFK